ncbi:MAG: hypothetical protein WBF33_38855 [Candidatus Nitrosopolaris sp.]
MMNKPQLIPMRKRFVFATTKGGRKKSVSNERKRTLQFHGNRNIFDHTADYMD